jgi:nucleoside-diphosphate-sugar epimerase
MAVNIHDISAAEKALTGTSFDVVVDWIAYTPDDIERDIQLFRGHTRQFIFISTASAYQKPVGHYLITESTPLANPHWDYSRNKIACEERLMKAYRDEGFPVTIVRPSLTYGDTQIPLVTNSWEKPYSIVDRMLKKQKVVVPGDGTSLWVITHNSDFAKGFVGLFGHAQAIGHAFHITSDEAMTWDQYYKIVADALDVEARIVHIPSDFIIACMPDQEGSLIGDKSVSVVFDNSKIKRFVPEYCATTSFAEGIRRTLSCFSSDPKRQEIDTTANNKWDKLIEVYEKGLHAAMQTFQ